MNEDKRMAEERLCFRPLKLKPARVHRNYTGGFLLEKWQKKEDPKDGNLPENWIASTVEARTDNYVKNEGLSKVDLGNGKEPFLKDIILENPEGFLGADYVREYSSDMAVLVKVIDSSSRLFIQVHPDRDFSKRIFNSPFGKTEAWYVLGGRKINDEDPYVLFGFKKGVTREKWRELFEKQDIQGMLDSLHRFSVKPGDIFFIESGIPHAIGSGCFLLEVQEPTDYTFRVERTAPDGRKLPDTFCHQGVGFENALNAFHYDTFDRDEILERFYLRPEIIETQMGGKRTSIISDRYSEFFAMEELNINEKFISEKPAGFAVGVVISGSGRLIFDGGELKVGQSDELFFPASLKEFTWEADSEENLKVVLSYPPRIRTAM